MKEAARQRAPLSRPKAGHAEWIVTEGEDGKFIDEFVGFGRSVGCA